jgi:hypothetical protein
MGFFHQTLKLNGTAHEYAWLGKHPHVRSMVINFMPGYKRGSSNELLPLFYPNDLLKTSNFASANRKSIPP